MLPFFFYIKNKYAHIAKQTKSITEILIMKLCLLNYYRLATN